MFMIEGLILSSFNDASLTA